MMMKNTPLAPPMPRATPRTSQEKLARDRAEHAKRRLRELRAICPDLPEDVLAHTSLRTLSFAVRRAGRRPPAQTALKTEARAPTAKSQHCPERARGEAGQEEEEALRERAEVSSS